ncbi:sodium-dependent transporter [Listeria sp. PSOL-1]|uniref:sodium-dependent transporter n=1 Tax=Listeria sp. PSOL-1 TaxID=1844999 RepID=UPI0013CFD5C6|nr:sodium-dependent transporter [Listeria sp. PSOL-1]
MEQSREEWSSKLGFILASAGSAIGIGAIWKLPYVAATAGGGAFFLLFLLITVFVVMPLLIAEFIIGRHSRKDAIVAYEKLAPGTKWNLIGRLGVIGASILFSFYSVVGGWIITYLFKAVTLTIHGTTQTQLLTEFANTTANPWISLLGTFVFIFLNVLVINRGVVAGIEKMNKVMMPALFILFIVLIIRSLTLPGAMSGVSYFLKPDFSHFTANTILITLGQAFFSLSVGLSVMVTYSSYLDKKTSLPGSALSVSLMNMVVSLLAGLAIFPAAFSFGIKPDAGPGLLFVILPTIFNQLPFGTFFFIIFLILFAFAALTSSFSLLEAIVAPLITKGATRRRATNWIGLLIVILAIPSALSFGVLSNIHLFGLTFFELADYLVSNIILPFGAFFIALFVGYRLPRAVLFEEFTASNHFGKKLFIIWLFVIRFVAPLAIIFVFLSATGLIKFLF